MKKKWSKCIMALLAVGVLCAGCGDDNNSQNDYGDNYDIEFNEGVHPLTLAELGKPMTMDGVMELTLYEGGFYDELYAHNAQEGGSHITAEDGESILGLYGVIKNMSSKMYEINQIADITVLIDGEYEYFGSIYPESEDGTSFISDGLFVDDKIRPKAERNCVPMCNVGNEVAAEASTIEITIDMKQDVDADEDALKKRYTMNLQMNY